MKLPFIKQKSKPDLPIRRRRLYEDTPAQALDSSQTTFRRSSTITGSSSHQVASASELAGQMQSPRAKAHHLHRRRRYVAMLLLGSLVAVGVLLVLLYQVIGTVNISLYGQIAPISKKDQAYYQQQIQNYFSRYPLQRLRIFINKQQLVEFLQSESITEVREVTSVMPDRLGSALITLKMREPVAGWIIHGTQQFVDIDGVVFERNFFRDPKVYIRDESALTQTQGQKIQAVASKRFLEFVGRSVTYFESHAQVVRQVIIPAATTRQVIIKLADGNNIKMAVDRPVGEQGEDALRALRYFQAHQIRPEYIDVRLSGRVFYR